MKLKIKEIQLKGFQTEKNDINNIIVVESNTMPKVSTKDAVNAFETAFNFLQQGDLEIDYKDFKAFKSLKRKLTLLNNEKLIQPNITNYFNN